MNEYRVRTSLTNETEGHVFSEFTEPLEDWGLGDDGTPNFGLIYRVMRSAYGRCVSSVYVDTDGPPRRVGWFFISRQEYEDTRESYLRGAWCTVERVVEPARDARVESVAVGEMR